MRSRRLKAAAGALACALVASACSLEPVDLEAERPLALRSTITDSEGNVLARLFEENRSLVSLRAVPKSLVNAVLAAEDDSFFEHPGYNLRSMARAALTNWRDGEIVQGGSTITQQYVKNVYFNKPARTVERKARELRLAMEVERAYAKEEILERYLNTVYLGGGAYGVKAAAESYFGRSIRTLTVAESALIAAVIKSPSLYDPRRNRKRARKRRDYVIDRMLELGMIGARAAARAESRPLGVTESVPRSPTRRPHFVEAVRRELLNNPRLGRTEEERAAALYKGGIRVETTLDPYLQDAAEDAVTGILDNPGDPEAALVAIRPQTGAIVAMVGGRSWHKSQVNLALGRAGGGSGRQSGSSFKPLALATALETGYTLTDTFESAPGTLTLAGGEPWTVRNAEGTERGPMTLADATVASVNGVYARLALALGGGQIASQAKLMGVRSKLTAVPSIALGSVEVSPLDMATAYATLANGGTAIEPTTIASIKVPGTMELVPEQETLPGALAPGNAYLVTKTLQEVIRRGTGRAAFIGRPAAGKTGTTNDFADAWFVGYTPDLVAAVWVGYPQGRIPMTNVHGIRVAGGTFPAQIWQTFMRAAHRGLPVRGFKAPRTELVTVRIDPATGLLAAPWCRGRRVRMLRQLVPTQTCPKPPPPPQPVASPSPTPSPRRTPRPEPAPSPAEAKPSPAPGANPTPSG